jgi:hypothetical protein
MTQVTSPSVQRRYSLTMVCHLWGLSRATMQRQRAARVAQGPRPSRVKGIARSGRGCAFATSGRPHAGCGGL